MLHFKYFNSTISHQLATDHETIAIIKFSQFWQNSLLILKNQTILWMSKVKLCSKVLQTNFKGFFATSISFKMLIKSGF